MAIQPESVELPSGYQGVRLRSEDIAVTLLPEKGCDIYSVVDTRTGVDLLFKTPWGLLPKEGGPLSPDSIGQWLRLYPGGWQVILPNGGAANQQYGTTWGFHGEASLVAWEYEPRGANGIGAEAGLFYAPLKLEREIEVDGPTLRVRETVTNDSPDEIEFMWGHHPAFGAPFLAEGCLISVGASTYTADDTAPGSVLEPGSAHQWPFATSDDGSQVDLSVVSGQGSRCDHLGYLTDFDQPFFAITNPELGLGVAMRWSPGILDRAWFWQELNSTAGFPWFRRAYVMAIEPNSTIPAQGLDVAKSKGGEPVVLAGGESATVELEMRVFDGGGYVSGIKEDGGVVLTEDRH